MSLFSKISIIILLIISGNINLFGQSRNHLHPLLTTKLDFFVRDYQNKLEEMGDLTNHKTDILAVKEGFVSLFSNENCPVYNDLNATEYDSELITRTYAAIFVDGTIKSVNSQITGTDIKYDTIIYKDTTYFISLAVKKTTNIVYRNNKPNYNSSPYWLNFTFIFNEDTAFTGLKLLSIKSLKTIDIEDYDKDGIINAFDKCPDKKGKICTYGCPDPDNDCLSDAEELRKIYGDAFYDRCPDLYGTKEEYGCSDGDKDGVYDDVDLCPKESGKKYLYGCPDSDNDSLSELKELWQIYPDLYDKCPNEYGPKCTFGCPDDDGDCIANKEDKCPKLPGTLIFKGCPDRDNDNVADNEDKCPCEKHENVNYNGCPHPIYQKPQKVLNNAIGYSGSLALIGFGINQELASRRIYSDYKNAGIERIAAPLYEEANKKHHNAILFGSTGVLLAGLTITRNFYKINQDKNDYYDVCKYANIDVKITPISIGLTYTF